ncbi:MAG TPA: hypothetical protein VM658_05380, partial [bacterium]|nr:hypothetical protein [bacterium]
NNNEPLFRSDWRQGKPAVILFILSILSKLFSFFYCFNVHSTMLPLVTGFTGLPKDADCLIFFIL